MASRTTTPNELPEQAILSGKIAKHHYRSTNSSKYGKFKEKRRSPRKSLFDESERENDDVKRELISKIPSEKFINKSGYSSSDETSDADFAKISRKGKKTKLLLSGKNAENLSSKSEIEIEECEIRKRKSCLENSDKFELKPDPAGNVEFHDDEINAEWELVDKCSKGSDISLTTANDSSDDFWKSDSHAKLISKEKSKVKKNKKKPRKKIEFFKRNWFSFFKRLKNEWKIFKEENYEELKRIKCVKNQCLLGALLVFIYCGIGGVIFHSTEGAFEMFYKCGVKRVKRDFLDTLWSKSYLAEAEWKSLARTKLMEFENQLYDAYEAGMNSYSGQKGWSFINSLIYTLTLVTTIGYGHIAPATTIGRIITIVYSLFGIPMFLILLADYGKLFTRGIKYLWAFVRRVYYYGSCRKVRKTAPVQEMVKGVQLVFDMTKLRRPSTINTETVEPAFPCRVSPTGTPAMSSYTIDDEFNLPISVAFGILLIYMFCGALFFSKSEGWGLFDSFYFVYISMSTIGFGDMVPRGQVHILLISLVYFIFGLSLTSMCINVVQEKLSDSFKQATAKIGATMGLEVTEDGAALNVPCINPPLEPIIEST